MNTHRTSEKVSQNLLAIVFLRSLYYTFPIGMFLTACNFLFESVRKYYFNWWIVIVPTVTVLLIGNLFEMYVIYQRNRELSKIERQTYVAKRVGYTMAKSKLVTN
ncbi:MAG: hypothetical protein V4585_15285 [Bacteroidota bacterium]|jgi:hypothetical protein